MAPKVQQSQPPSSTGSTSVEDLFSLLNRHIEQAEYAEAVRLSDQILSISPKDEDALRCKIASLIKNNDTEQALSVIQTSRNISLDLSFYQAYCLYRGNKLDEALKVLKTREPDDASMLLEAQILHRLEKTDACLEIYRQLQNSKIESLEINMVAGLTSSGRASEVQGLMETLRLKATSSSDLAYNTACAFIQTGKLTEAEQLLLSARRIGQEELMDDNMSDDEIEKELARISVQLAYVRQLLSRKQEALESYSNVLNRNLGDEASLAVALNNTIALKGPREISDSLRKLERLFGDSCLKFSGELDQKLSKDEKETMSTNRLLLMLQSKKIDRVRESLPLLPSERRMLIEAAVLVRENKPREGEEVLSQFVEKFPEKSKSALLARAQIAAGAGHAEVAFESLAMVPGIQHMPATVATLVALKERAGDVGGAEAVLDSALKWWSDSMRENDDILDVIVHEAASFKLKHGKDGDAAGLYEKLFNRHGGVDALARLVMTSACISIDKAEAYEKRLKPLPGLAEINVDLLEKSPVEGGDARDGPKTKTKKKRKRKPRYPKGFDPANPGPPPDPERWLPKRERSSYRPKRKDKRAAVIRGSQGALVRGDDGSSKSNKPTSSKGEQPKSTSKSSKKKHKK